MSIAEIDLAAKLAKEIVHDFEETETRKKKTDPKLDMSSISPFAFGTSNKIVFSDKWGFGWLGVTLAQQCVMKSRIDDASNPTYT